jgi:hypothetical protein
MTKILTQEEKATIVKLIGLNFVKEEDEIAVVLEKNSNLITPYTYKSLATVIIAKLNNLTNQSIYRLPLTNLRLLIFYNLANTSNTPLLINLTIPSLPNPP